MSFATGSGSSFRDVRAPVQEEECDVRQNVQDLSTYAQSVTYLHCERKRNLVVHHAPDAADVETPVVHANAVSVESCSKALSKMDLQQQQAYRTVLRRWS